MNPVRWKYLSAALFVMSIVFFASIIALPQVKTPQHAVYRGPAVPYGTGDTALSGYYIPTVDAGSKVTISIDEFVPGDVDITVFPTQPGAIAPTSGPVYIKTPLFNLSATFKENVTQPYGIYVISRNGTKFTLGVEATYSPFYWLPAYSSIGVILVLATGVLLYYYTFTSKRWKLEQQAIHEAREGTRASADLGR